MNVGERIRARKMEQKKEMKYEQELFRNMEGQSWSRAELSGELVASNKRICVGEVGLIPLKKSKIIG